MPRLSRTPQVFATRPPAVHAGDYETNQRRIPGVAWSDHWSFWQHGYRATMLTDTAPYRYPHYHLHTDTPERLDYERMAQVVTGCAAVIHAWT